MDLIDLDLADVMQILDQQFAIGSDFQDIDPVDAVQPGAAARVCPIVARAYHLANAGERPLRSGQPGRGFLGGDKRRGFHFAQAGRPADACERFGLRDAGASGPRLIRHGIGKGAFRFFTHEDGGEIGRALEDLHRAQIMHDDRLEAPSLFGCALRRVSQLSEAVTRALRLEYALRDDEPESPVFFQVVVHRGVGEQHGEVFLASAQASLRPRQCKEPVFLPERLHGVAVAVGQVLPVHPGRIARHVVHPADEQRGEGVLDDARPDAVLVVGVESPEIVIELLVKSGFRRGYGFCFATFEELFGRVAVADAEFERIGVAADMLAALGDLHGNVEVAGAGIELQRLSQPFRVEFPVFRRRHDRVAQIDGQFDLAGVTQQVADGHQVVRARGHDGERVQVEADDVAQDFAQQLLLAEAALVAMRVEPSLDAVQRHHEKCARAAGGVEQALVRVAVVAEFFKREFRQPVGRVVFAQIVADGLGKKLLVELLEQVAGFGGIDAERSGVELIEGARHRADGVAAVLAPGVEIPGEEVAFEKVANAGLRPDAALFEISQFVPQFGRSRSGGDLLYRGNPDGREGGDDFSGQHLHEDGVPGVNGEEEFGRMGIGGAILLGQFPDFGILIMKVVAANHAEQNPPLVEEDPRLGTGGLVEELVNEADAALRALTLGAEVSGEVLGREREPPRAHRNDCPQQTLDRVRRDRLGILHVEPDPWLSREHERGAVAAHAEDALHADALFRLEVPEAFFELIDDSPRACALCDSACAFRILVFDDHAAVFRVDASARQSVFVLSSDVQIRFVDELVDERVAGVPNVLLGAGLPRRRGHSLGHALGVGLDERFQVRIHNESPPLSRLVFVKIASS